MNHINLLFSWSVNGKDWKLPFLGAANLFGLLQFRLVRWILDIKEERLPNKISQYVIEHLGEKTQLRESYKYLLVHKWKIKQPDQFQQDWYHIFRTLVEAKTDLNNFWNLVTNAETEGITEIFVPFVKQTIPIFMLMKLKENAVPLERLISDVYCLNFKEEQLSLNGFHWHYLMLESTYFKSIGNNPSFKECQNQSIQIENFGLEEMKEFLSCIEQKKPKINASNVLSLLRMAYYFGCSSIQRCTIAYLNDSLIQEDCDELLDLAKVLWDESLHEALALVENSLIIKFREAARLDKQTFISVIQPGEDKGIFLNELDLSESSFIDDECLAKLAIWPLKKLNLSSCINVTSQGYVSLVAQQSLEVLDLSNNPITDQMLAIIAQIQSLRHLNLNGCEKITDKGLKSLEVLQSLEHLDLGFCIESATEESIYLNSHFTDKGLESIGKIYSLKYLNLELGISAITDKGLESLQTLHSLEYLNLNHNSAISNKQLEITRSCLKSLVVHFPCLQHLEIEGWKNIRSSDIELVASLQFLKHLNISWCSTITDQDLETLATCKTLTHLTLDGCEITDQGLSKLVKYQSLEYLSLNSCSLITDQSLLSISQLCFLKHLELSQGVFMVDLITDEGIKALAALQSLEYLNLNRCTNIKCISPLKNLPLLHHLNLNQCLRIEDSSLAEIAIFPSLQYLDLGFCSITDRGLPLLAHSQSLQTLILNGCSSISNKGLKALTTIQSLKKIEIYRENRIKEEEVAELMQLNPNLQIKG